MVGAASISSYFLGALLRVAAKAMVRAAVRVVFPWSTWPIVPMLTWGFFLSNFPRAARTLKERPRVVMVEEDEGESVVEKDEQGEGVVERQEEMKEEESRVLGVSGGFCKGRGGMRLN